MRTGVTFSDVLLVPKRTPLYSRSEANIKTKLPKKALFQYQRFHADYFLQERIDIL